MGKADISSKYVLRESPWYNQILEEGLQQGLQQGQMENRRAQRENILQVLRVRFGLSQQGESPLADRLETIDDLEALRDLFNHALLDVTLTDFSTQLEQAADGR